MNITNDYYQNTNYCYTEIGIALDDFIYGEIVKISIPTITPFMENNEEVKSTEVVSTVNIINDNINALGITSYDSRKISTGNSMELKVPYYLADYKRTPIVHPFSAHNAGHPAVPHTDMVQLDWNGKKGTRFIITFVGGELNNAKIIGRMD